MGKDEEEGIEAKMGNKVEETKSKKKVAKYEKRNEVNRNKWVEETKEKKKIMKDEEGNEVKGSKQAKETKENKKLRNKKDGRKGGEEESEGEENRGNKKGD